MACKDKLIKSQFSPIFALDLDHLSLVAQTIFLVSLDNVLNFELRSAYLICVINDNSYFEFW